MSRRSSLGIRQSAGVGEWPEPLVRSGDGLGWRRFIVHPVVSAILLASAILVPIRPDEAEAARQMEEPLAWEEVEEWIETLDEEEFIEPDRLDSIREQVKELRLQPMDEWYSHSSLEASDSLRQQTEQARSASWRATSIPPRRGSKL